MGGRESIGSALIPPSTTLSGALSGEFLPQTACRFQAGSCAMSLSPAIIDAMLAAGCTALQIAEAVKASLREEEEQRAEARERRRIQNRVRQQKYRDNSKARNATLRVIERYDALLPSSPNSPKGFSPTPPFPKPLNPSNPITPLAPLKGGIPPRKIRSQPLSRPSGADTRNVLVGETPKRLLNGLGSGQTSMQSWLGWIGMFGSEMTGRGVILRHG